MNTLKKVIFASICVAFLAVKWTAPRFEAESLRGARVVVTGASTGIGEQMAYHYARFGAQIVITARREKVLQQVAEKCLSLGAQKALYIAADMGSDSDPDKVVDFALEKLGGLDYLVLNHIGPSPFSMWDGDVEHTKWLMKVNFFSYIQMAWKAMSALEQSKGSLVVVSSLLGKMANPFVAPYASTKFALNGFFGALQHELAMKKSNVSISICTLGLIDTDSAMEKVRGVTNVPAYPATDAAMNIIITGATRQLELFYPWPTYLLTLTKDWFPSITNYIIQNSYNHIP
ncbi:Hydroxysteroid 11-beta-dehydrogenase 1-like protein [Larimichthys crocea]|uniref:Hydroxysteroid 11-beta-dehydrogenase 1-like protein n=1 Tax=Larimichthys crocea TaxID=215358 RepID=A0A0F8AG80_LARCR|nr:hydroxysteroid 11-beta-dehydrogenase 1-like protein [Larimichthys crocea]KAE8294318.1 Hydroxysteroid 11-beta-dehydrogenase 1-like protein [Larimichthys crocea]